MKLHWAKHLLACQRRGFKAFQDGEPREPPYTIKSPWAYKGPENMTRQRNEYWLIGWDFGKSQQEQPDAKP